jgi:hypothetical protein
VAIKFVPRMICDFCAREQLDPPLSWRSFDIAVQSIGFRPRVDLCDHCTGMPFGEVVAQVEAQYRKENPPCPR